MTPSEVRAPRLTVLAQGQELPGVLAADIESNAYLGANRFSLRVAFSATDEPFWGTLPLSIEIQLGMDGAQASLITGHADSVDWDAIRGEAVLHGRDLTALFIAAQTGETFENQTASAIVQLLAARRGLTPNAAATNGLVGRFYQAGHTRHALSQHARATSEWDILTWLADQQNFDVWVTGTTLNFQPLPSGPAGATVTPGDCLTLKLRQSLDLAGGITAIVKSWNSQSQTQVTQMASQGSGGLTLVAVRPNLSAADAMGLAQNTVAGLSAHALEIAYDMPGDLTTMPRDVINFTGTGTNFDTVYEIVEVDRRISFDYGFLQSVVARALPWTPS